MSTAKKRYNAPLVPLERERKGTIIDHLLQERFYAQFSLGIISLNPEGKLVKQIFFSFYR